MPAIFRLLSTLTAPLAQATGMPESRPSYWIFGEVPQGMALMLLKAAIIVVTVAALCLLLRLLYGPGGPLRPKEFGTGHIEERRRRKAELKALKARRKAGDITRGQYLDQRWEILRKR